VDQCLYMRLMGWAMRGGYKRPRAAMPSRLRGLFAFF
jgi:hypothetical protein